MFFAALIP